MSPVLTTNVPIQQSSAHPGIAPKSGRLKPPTMLQQLLSPSPATSSTLQDLHGESLISLWFCWLAMPPVTHVLAQLLINVWAVPTQVSSWGTLVSNNVQWCQYLVWTFALQRVQVGFIQWRQPAPVPPVARDALSAQVHFRRIVSWMSMSLHYGNNKSNFGFSSSC